MMIAMNPAPARAARRADTARRPSARRPLGHAGARAAVLLLWGAVGLAGSAGANPAEADQAFFKRTSVCAAVLKQEVVTLQGRVNKGEGQLRGDIQRLTEQSFAYVGTAYKRGLRNPQADQLLGEAEAALKRLPPATQRQQLQECQAEGSRILANANALERALVRNRAKARVDQLLEGAPRAS